MVRLLRSIPEYMYLGGEFPGLSEALEELGIKSAGGQIVFLLGRAIAHWNIETEPEIHSHTVVDGPRLIRRLATLTKGLRTIEYVLGTSWEDQSLEPDEIDYVEMYNFPMLIARLAQELAEMPKTGGNPRAYLAEFRARVVP